MTTTVRALLVTLGLLAGGHGWWPHQGSWPARRCVVQTVKQPHTLPCGRP